MLSWKIILDHAENGNLPPPKRVEKTLEAWRKELTTEAFHITRNKGTEPAFSSKSCSQFEPGIYVCVCCDTVLFDASNKFNSSTGWPSFTQPVTDDVIQYQLDNSYGIQRIEVLCNICDAHLGHVFYDGPTANGLHYCINAIALKKQEIKLKESAC
jgi:peptide-methionine (R)-S-oxide reductase